MDVRVITLERTPDRLERFIADNATTIGAVPFAAIDGQRIDRSALVEQGLLSPSVHYSNGALGCALSHRALWQTAIELQHPITVLEDDAVLNDRFRERATQVIATLTNCDFIAWGWNFDSILHFELLPGIAETVSRFNQDRLRDNIDKFAAADIHPQAYRLRRAFGTIGYTVSPRGAARLASACFPLAPLSIHFPALGKSLPNVGIDIAMNAVYADLNAYVAIPPLVVTRNDGAASTVQTPRGGS